MKRCSINKNPKIEIGIQPEGQKNTDSYLYLSPNDDPASRNLKLKLCLRAFSSHLIFLSSAGIKGLHHYHPGSCV